MSGEDLPQTVSGMLADYTSRVLPATVSDNNREVISNAYIAGVAAALTLVLMSRDDFDATMERLADELELLAAEKH